jgi:hypothetical protein
MIRELYSDSSVPIRWSGMKLELVEHLVDLLGVAGHGEPCDQQVVGCHRRNSSPILQIVPGGEQLVGVHAHGKLPAERTVEGSAHTSGIARVDQARQTKLRQILDSGPIDVGLAHKIGKGRPDSADDKRSHVEFLPHLQVSSNGNSNLPVGSHFDSQPAEWISRTRFRCMIRPSALDPQPSPTLNHTRTTMHTGQMDDTAFAHYQEHGYVILPEVLTNEGCLAIKAALEPYVDGSYPGRNDFEGFYSERVYKLISRSPVFADLLEHPVALGALDRIMTPGYLISAFLSILVHPGETPQDLHFDDGFVQHPRPRPSNMVSIIWAIDEFTETNGATELVPGSHRWSEGQSQPDDAAVTMAVMPAGSALIMDGLLIHRGGANTSSTDRLAITPQYCEPWARQQENHILATPPELTATLSTRVRELMGYSIHPPFMGHVGGRHPDKRLTEILAEAGSQSSS